MGEDIIERCAYLERCLAYSIGELSRHNLDILRVTPIDVLRQMREYLLADSVCSEHELRNLIDQTPPPQFPSA